MSVAATQLSPDRPWPGLDSFTEENRRYFFGREAETAELHRLVEQETLTSLFGQSGLGKTSLLRAGLYPLLRAADYLPVHLRLDLSDAAPDLVEQIFAVARAEAQGQSIEMPPARPGETLWEFFHRRGNDWWTGAQAVIPVLVFDQFEEIFSLGQATEARRARCEALIDQLAWLIEGAVPPALAQRFEAGAESAAAFDFRRRDFRVVFAFREDFLADFEDLRKRNRIRSLFHARLRLAPFKTADALRVITKAGGHLFAPEVADRIVAFVAGEAETAARSKATRPSGDTVEPALLSLVCEQLNEQRIARGQPLITAELLDRSRQEILRLFYEQATRDLAPEVRTFIEDHLITESGFRIPLPMTDALRRPGMTPDVIESLVTRRLLRVAPGTAIERIELIHDVLTEVVLKARTARAATAEQARLRKEAQASRRKAIVAYAMVAVSVLAAFYFYQTLKLAESREQRARAAEESRNDALRQLAARQFASESQHLLASDVVGSALVAMLLAAAAERIDPGHPENFNALLTAIAKSGSAAWVRELGSDPSALALSADGQRVAVGMALGGLQMWDGVRGSALFADSSAHKQAITALAFSADGRLLASGADDRMLRIWNAETGAPIASKGGEQDDVIVSIVFSPDGQKLVTGGADSSVRLWDLSQDQPVMSFGSGEWTDIRALAFSPDGNTIVSAGGAGGSLRLWNSADGRLTQESKEGHSRPIRTLAVDGTGRRIVTGGADGQVRIWDARSREPIGEPLPGHRGTVNAVAISRDGTRIASGADDGEVRLWNAQTGEAIGEPLTGHRGSVNAVAFSPDGRLLATAGEDRNVRLWNVGSRTLDGAPLSGHGGRIYALAFSPDQRRLASGSFDDTIRIWDLPRRNVIATLRGHGDTVRALAFRHDGRMIASGAEDKTVRFWDMERFGQIGEPWRLPVDVLAVAFSPNGRTLAAGGIGDGLRMLTVDERKPLNTVSRHRGPVRGVAIHPEGKFVASAAADGARVWDMNGALVSELDSRGRAVGSVAFSRDGGRLVYGDDRGVLRIADGASYRDVNNIELGRRFEGRGAIRSVRFGRDESVLIVTFTSGAVFEVPIGGGGTPRMLIDEQRGSSTIVASAARSGAMAIASGERLLRVTNADRKENLKRSVAQLRGRAQALAVATDGAHLVVGGEDEALLVLEGARTRRFGSPKLASWRQPVAVHSAVFSRDGRHIVTAGRDARLRVWDSASGSQLFETGEGHSDWIRQIAVSPDGQLLATASRDRTVRLWRWDGSALRAAGAPLSLHESPVLRVQFSPDGRVLASGAEDGTVRLWEVPTGRPHGDALSAHKGAISALAFSPDGMQLVTGSRDSTLRRWDARSGQTIGDPLHGHRGLVQAIVFTHQGQRIASASFDRTIRFWDAGSGAPLGAPIRGHNREIESMSSTPDGAMLITTSGDGFVRAWDPNGAGLRGILGFSAESLWSAAVSPDGSRLVTAGADGSIHLWSLTQGLEPDGMRRLGDIRGVAVSTDGKWVAAGGEDGMVRVWEAASGRASRTFEHGSPVYSVAISPDGRWVVSGGFDDVLRIWDLETGERVADPLQHGNTVTAAMFTRDGARIVTGADDRIVRVWEASTGKLIAELKGHTGSIKALALHADGRIVSASEDETLRIWSAQHNETVAILRGHETPVRAVAISPDGKAILSADDRGHVRLWDMETGRALVRTLPSAGTAVHAIGFVGNQKQFVTAAESGEVALWNFDPSALANAICAMVGRDLTPSEWKRYAGGGMPPRAVCER